MAVQPTASRSPRPSVGERRQLTVLFCDIVASTQHASQLDPEDWQQLVGAYQRACTESVEGFDGHVAQYLGDGVLAYFGYPRAHEDGAERAVRAGRVLIDAMAELRGRPDLSRLPPLSVRIGIHTGPVVMGEVGVGRRTQTLALGSTTNIAARLQEIAEPDGLVISETTERLVRGVFVTEELGRRKLKGLSRAPAAYRVVRGGGVRSRLELFGRAPTPFVGREAELVLLSERWERVVRGEGQSVLVEGEAGVGKTRLALALRESLARTPYLWLECSASAHARGSAFHPVIELLERGLALAEDDEAPERLRKLRSELARTGAEEALPPLARLLDLPMPEASDPEGEARERTVGALVAWVLGLAESRPVFLLVEDLHWADPSTLELLGRLAEQLPGRRVLLLITARPEFAAPWHASGSWTQISLVGLQRPQARALVEAALGASPLPVAAIDQILERSDGIPLHLEELTRTALESKGGSSEIPSTLQDSLMARLDRLGPGKPLALLSAVIGREFSERLLTAVHAEPDSLGIGLERLLASGLVVKREEGPDAAYVFRHALIHEAAYASLPRERRQALHERVARALQEQLPERAAAEPETLARHFQEARMPLPAIHCYLRAGRRESARSASREALDHLTRGLALVPTLPEPQREREELALLVAMGPPLTALEGPGDDQTGRVYQRARALCSPAAPELLHVLSGLFTFHLNRGEMDAAFEVAREQLELAERGAEPAHQMRAHWSLGQTLCLRGESPRAIEHLERALRLFDPARDRVLGHDRSDQGISLRSWLGWASWIAGRPDRARRWADTAVAHAREGGHAYSLAYALGFAAVLQYMLGDRERGRWLARETVTVSRQRGFPLYLAVGRLVEVWAGAPTSLSGDGDSAVVERFRGALGSLTGRGNQFGRPIASAALAEILRDSGRLREALETLHSARAFGAQTGIRYWDAELLRVEAETLLRSEGVADRHSVERMLRESLDTATRQGARSHALRAATSLARLLCEVGETSVARSLVAPIYAAFEEGLDTPDLDVARALMRG